jgi:sugar (pentulose or hexulose) kinase
MDSPNLALGIDFGTSGVRGAVVDGRRQVLWEWRQGYPASNQGAPHGWRVALFTLLDCLPSSLAQGIGAIAINGTPATVLLVDDQGNPVIEPLMYYDKRGGDVLELIRAMAPPDSPVVSATSSLAKLLWWHRTLSFEVWQQAQYFLSQADWLSAQLHGQWGVSDYHNSLKLGYNVGELCFPKWLHNQPWSHLLPAVKAPGAIIGPVKREFVQKFKFSPTCHVVAGTTDSIAAFLASGADQVGEAVTSLGSTLVLKLLSQHRVDASQYGIYSHRLGNLWLVGGASNTGGAVLKQFFDAETLAELSQKVDPATSSQLDYYPLVSPGERFPINDPDLLPQLTPRPKDDITFLRELLWGMVRIEKQGYHLLETLGASPVTQIYTAGVGAQNEPWRIMRTHALQKPRKTAAHPEAAVGAAFLALGSLSRHQTT